MSLRLRWVPGLLIVLIFSSAALSVTGQKASPKWVANETANETALPTSKSPDESLLRLQEANDRFVTGNMINPRRLITLRRELAAKQHPDAIVLSCSDSRVPPEIIFDEGLGELFIVRTAGHVVDDMVMASVEYGIDHLKANLVVVLGHESCGAIQTALSLPPGASAGSSHLDHLVSVIRENLNHSQITKSSDPLAADAAQAHIKGTIDSLLKQSKIVRDSVEKGKVKIVPAIYHIDDGHVVFLKF